MEKCRSRHGTVQDKETKWWQDLQSVSSPLNSLGVKFQTTFVVCSNYRLERRLFVKLKGWMSNSIDPDETAQSGSMLFAKAYHYRQWQWKSKRYRKNSILKRKKNRLKKHSPPQRKRKRKKTKTKVNKNKKKKNNQYAGSCAYLHYYYSDNLAYVRSIISTLLPFDVVSYAKAIVRIHGCAGWTRTLLSTGLGGGGGEGEGVTWV